MLDRTICSSICSFGVLNLENDIQTFLILEIFEILDMYPRNTVSAIIKKGFCNNQEKLRKLDKGIIVL